MLLINKTKLANASEVFVSIPNSPLYNDAKSEAVNYCNEIYAYDGLCETNTVWPMDKKDFVTTNSIPFIKLAQGTNRGICPKR